MNIKRQRLNNLDAWRGLAIIIMIFANSSAYILPQPHALLLRFFFSFAAPLFIFLSGFSFAVSISYKFEKFVKYKNAIYLLITASLIDFFVWDIFPFGTFDVLYIIGIGILTNTIITDYSWKLKISIIFIILISYFMTTKYIYYRFDVIENENSIFNSDFFVNYLIDKPLKRFLIDGWFPILPWLSLIVLGGIIVEKSFFILNNKIIIKCLAWTMLMFGSFFVLVNPHIQPERNDYLELFYPPSLTFLIMSIGLCVLVSIHILSNYEIENKIFKILSRLGRRSLFVYILHCIIISFILKNNFSNLSTLIFLVLDSIFILIIYLSVYLIENKNSLEIINRFPNSIQRIFGLK